MKNWSRFLFIVFISASCSKQQSNPQTNQTANRHRTNFSERSELAISELQRERAHFLPRPEREGLDVLKYELSGTFDWAQQKLNAQVTVTFKLIGTQSLILDSEVRHIQSVKTEAGVALPFTYTNSLLTIDASSLTTAEKKVVIAYDTIANMDENGEGTSFSAVPHRDGDRVSSRVAFTASEPLGTSQWMPCHNVPTDRALFATDFTIDATERFIANGDNLEDSVQGAQRHVRFATRYTLPTYMMAFAFGEFETATVMHGNLPVSIMHRRGLKGDWDGMAQEIRRNIISYEQLLIPFPFEKYTVVALPDFPAGGIENASITFQAEHRSSQSQLGYDRGLAAHELGHQWFGNYITVASWDDLWIKEGMATLLSEESSRHYMDINGSGRLFGFQFEPAATDAISDPQLPPNSKYTSGPYDRAAWFLTQLRSKVGEQQFWGTLRQILQDHAQGNISSEQFFAAFAPLLSADDLQKAKQAILVKGVPTLDATRNGAGEIVLGLEDPTNTMLVPLTVAVANQAGAFVQTVTLAAGEHKTLSIAEGNVLVFDPADIQAWGAFKTTESFDQIIPQLVIPRSFNTLKALPPSAQEFALNFPENWSFSADQTFDRASAYVSSSAAQYLLVKTACNVAKRTANDQTLPLWKSKISRILQEPPTTSLTRSLFGTALAECGKFTDPALFTDALQTIRLSPSANDIPETTVLYLAHMDQDPRTAFGTWGNLALQGGTVRSQNWALATLGKRLATNTAFTAPTGSELAHFKDVLQQVTLQTGAMEVQATLLPILANLKDSSFVLPLVHPIQRSLRPAAQEKGICTAYALSQGNAALWNQFVGAFGDQSRLTTKVRGLLTQPAQHCQ